MSENKSLEVHIEYDVYRDLTYTPGKAWGILILTLETTQTVLNSIQHFAGKVKSFFLTQQWEVSTSPR